MTRKVLITIQLTVDCPLEATFDEINNVLRNEMTYVFDSNSRRIEVDADEIVDIKYPSETPVYDAAPDVIKRIVKNAHEPKQSFIVTYVAIRETYEKEFSDYNEAQALKLSDVEQSTINQPITYYHMARMKQYKGIQLENRDGSRPVCTERFTRRTQYNSRYVLEIQYRIKDLDHEYNYWDDAAGIKYKIDQALAGNSIYKYILNNQ